MDDWELQHPGDDSDSREYFGINSSDRASELSVDIRENPGTDSGINVVKGSDPIPDDCGVFLSGSSEASVSGRSGTSVSGSIYKQAGGEWDWVTEINNLELGEGAELYTPDKKI